MWSRVVLCLGQHPEEGAAYGIGLSLSEQTEFLRETLNRMLQEHGYSIRKAKSFQEFQGRATKLPILTSGVNRRP